MKYITLDIETVPLKIENEDVKSYLMDKKISKERRSLDPNYSKIIVICVKKNNEECKVLSGDNEKRLLEEFWSILKDNKDFVIVTHNGYQFDVPFIIIRSIFNNIEIPFAINTNKWAMENSNHFDTMVFFSQYGAFINPNLDILSRLHGIEVPGNRVMGSEVEKLYINGEWEKIKNKCKEDIEILEKFFEKACLRYLESKRKT